MNAKRITNGRIDIDAKSSEPEWSKADRRGGFRAREPREGEPSDSTYVSALYDDDYLYLLVDLEDRQPQLIQGRLTRRDEVSTSDWVSVYIATQNNQRFAYRFSINAAGVKQDARILDGATEDLTYDALWDAAVRRHDRGWTAEYKIPFHQLNYGGVPAFRIQVIRFQSRTGEQSTLFQFPKSATNFVAHLGPLRGLDQLPNPVRAELAPYVSMTLNDDVDSMAPRFRIGGDLKLTLGPEAVLNATVNPDFGQIEADPSELNLSVFETFLPERRPFFLEGFETLDAELRGGITTDRLFYTRRIGQPPRVDPNWTTDDFLDYPKQTRIILATKLSARTSRGYTVGLLHALTDEAYATLSQSGYQRRVKVAPLTQFGVARVVRDFGQGRTSVGGTLTVVNRDLGAALDETLAKNATTAGFELEHRAGDIKLNAKAFASRVEGSVKAIRILQEDSVHYFQRPLQHHARLDPNRRVLDGWGLTLVGSKYSGAPWRAAWGGTIISPGFEPNDLGFLQRADEINGYVYLQYLENSPTRYYRSYFFDVNTWSTYTFGGELTSRAVAASANWVLPDTSFFRIAYERDTERLDPRVLRGGPALRIPGRNIFSVFASTDDRRSVSLDVSAWSGRHDNAISYWVGTAGQLRIRPTSFIQLAIAPWYQHSYDGFAYVDTLANGNAVTARMPRDIVSATLRASIAMTANLTLQLYTMPYFTSATRTQLAEAVSPLSSEFAAHFRPVAFDTDRYIWFAQARTNVILRWEYSPGSTAYFVWSRDQHEDRNDRGNLSFWRDVESLWNASANDVLMLKWSPRLAY
ncbi:MAG TPA: DUF5916 domain-containing protein [Polyangiaceae bacterium]